MQNNDKQKIITNILNETLNLKLEKINFEKIEKYKGISEYEFYLLNLIGITKSGEKQSIFIKSINIRLTVTENSGTGKGYLETIKHG